VQEVTDSIFALLKSAPWMGHYVADPVENQAYYTALLYRKDAVSSAQPFKLHRFRNSCMGVRLMRCSSVQCSLANALDVLHSILSRKYDKSTVVS